MLRQSDMKSPIGRKDPVRMDSKVKPAPYYAPNYEAKMQTGMEAAMIKVGKQYTM